MSIQTPSTLEDSEYQVFVYIKHINWCENIKKISLYLEAKNNHHIHLKT